MSVKRTTLGPLKAFIQFKVGGFTKAFCKYDGLEAEKSHVKGEHPIHPKNQSLMQYGKALPVTY